MDANTLGESEEIWNELTADIPPEGDEKRVQSACDVLNEAQTIVDEWIKQGGLRQANWSSGSDTYQHNEVVSAREEVEHLHPAKFTIDTLGDRVFEGYTKDEDWNGWACPYFIFEQAESIVAAYHEKGWPARYDQTNDHFVFSMQHAGGNDDEIYASIEEDGLKLYPIGAANWIWEEADKWALNADSPSMTSGANQ